MLAPRHHRTEDDRRLDRLENIVLALAGKVKKMAAGQEHYEASFGRLQDSITALGRDLGAKLSDLVAAHDQADDENFEAHAGQLDELVNQVQNLGKADNQATTAGQSPSGTAGPSSGDLPQGRGPLAQPEGSETDGS
jgi:hypothetical protein